MEQKKKKIPTWAIVLLGLMGLSIIMNLFNSKSKPQIADNESISADTANLDKIKPVFDLKSIANKTQKEVAEVLGKGTFEKNWKDAKAGCTACPKYTYQKEAYEVIFINGKADRIVINNLKPYECNDTAITLLGLKSTTPSFANAGLVYRWKEIEGFREVSIFDDGSGKINYALIQTNAQ